MLSSNRYAGQIASALLGALALAFVPAAADCGSACSASCDALGSGPAWASCMEDCLDQCLANDPPEVPDVPPPTPVEEESGDAKSLPLAAAPQEAPAPVLAETSWRFVEVLGVPVPATIEATLAFAADGTASGVSGCNRFTATYTAADADLAFSAVGSTKMMCEPERMTVEMSIQNALSHTRHAAEAEGELRLMASDGSVLARLAR
jgi:heat shock protein HslJ